MDGRSKRKKEVEPRYCEVCGDLIPRNTKQGEKRINITQYIKARFCSLKCKGLDHKENIKGKNNPNWRGGKTKCCLCGIELSYRYSYRTNSIGVNFCKPCANQYFSGENSWNWNGGTSPRLSNNKIYKDWRFDVFSRDDFTCQKCGDNKGGNLEAHHIINWKNNKDLRYLIDNGITFCEVCHRSFHKKYGYHDNNEEQLLKFIK